MANNPQAIPPPPPVSQFPFLPHPPPVDSAPPSSETLATILVRHLPEAITVETLTRLFSHYGASAVRPCAGGRMRNCAFVDFKDEATANQAQSLLNRLRFLGKVLIVERANQPNMKNSSQKHKEQVVRDSSHALKIETPRNSTLVAEPIAPRLSVDYPFPPQLEYAYPPPDGNILTNIVNALIAVPRFYTQVLHLMNKMNIPAPFRMALPTPPLPPQAPASPPPPPPSVIEKPQSNLSSDESELESSDENVSESGNRKRKRAETIIGPAIDKTVTHEKVGLKPAALVPNELPVIRKKIPVVQIKIGSKTAKKEDSSDRADSMEVEPVKAQPEEKKHFVTPDEIEKGKLRPEELLSLPMFKNYAPGNPSNTLYVKNLAKDVIRDDFLFIFGSFFDDIEATKSALSINLFQEGRMRGQAFVTFPSTELAHAALSLVNGYVFKGKPMIVQFGRNSSAKKAA